MGKNSLKLYTTNQVKQACFHLILGEVKGKKAAVIDRVNQMITPVIWSLAHVSSGHFLPTSRRTIRNGKRL